MGPGGCQLVRTRPFVQLYTTNSCCIPKGELGGGLDGVLDGKERWRRLAAVSRISYFVQAIPRVPMRELKKQGGKAAVIEAAPPLGM